MVNKYQRRDDIMEDGPINSAIKFVLVGDAAVGKTAMVISYTRNGFPAEYVPTAFDNYAVEVTVNEEPVQVEICDTPGQSDFDQLRTLCYPTADVFLLCFSVASPQSFRNVTKKWLPELRTHRPAVPVVLVATELDLRNDVKIMIELSGYGEKPVSEAEGRKLMKDYRGIVSYIECSALTQQNLKDVFDKSLLAALIHRQNLMATATEKHASISSMFCRKISLPVKSVKQVENNNTSNRLSNKWKQSLGRKQNGKNGKRSKWEDEGKDGGREYWSDGDDWLNRHRTDLYNEGSQNARNKSASFGKCNTVGSRLGTWSVDRSTYARKPTNGAGSEGEWSNLATMKEERSQVMQSTSQNHSCRAKQYSSDISYTNSLPENSLSGAEHRTWWQNLSCCFT